MEKPEIANEIIAHLETLLAGSNPCLIIDADTDLIGAGLLDSLNIVRLIQFVETRFDIQIEDDDISPELFISANRLAQYVSTRI
ncbi:MAG TPA: acyl carrier protein [Devosia sp.]|nr:acyl carrier protein [Devosia sp.]